MFSRLNPRFVKHLSTLRKSSSYVEHSLVGFFLHDKSFYYEQINDHANAILCCELAIEYGNLMAYYRLENYHIILRKLKQEESRHEHIMNILQLSRSRIFTGINFLKN
jgi:hypothetical protein